MAHFVTNAFSEMTYYGGTKRARYINSLINQDQGGGPKKAGTPYEIGRGPWSSMFIMRQPVSFYQRNLLSWNVSQTRPMGFTVNIRRWGP